VAAWEPTSANSCGTCAGLLAAATERGPPDHVKAQQQRKGLPARDRSAGRQTLPRVAKEASTAASTCRRVVVVESPSMDRLRSWYASADYAEALAVRETALTRRLLFVPGVEDAVTG